MARDVIRLRDIADKTGFSTNTVSLALRESTRIPLETRSIIQSAALELGYLPNQIAKSLVSRETRTIGLVLTDILNPTLTHTAQAVEMALAERGYGTLFATSNNTLSEEMKVVEMFRSRQVDGILIYPVRHRELEHLRSLRRANYPIVLLIADPDAGIDGVSVNDRSGVFQATRHLIGLGHRSIGFLDATRAAGNYEKFEGYQQALAASGLPFDDDLVVATNGHYARHGFYALDTLMGGSKIPTAVVCRQRFAGARRAALVPQAWAARAPGPGHHGLRQHRHLGVRRAAAFDGELRRRIGFPHGGRSADAADRHQRPRCPSRASPRSIPN